MNNNLKELPININYNSEEIRAWLTKASRALAELKGICKTMPNQYILINAIMINEAKASSEIENIVTSHDEIYKAMVNADVNNPYAKEVVDYRSAILAGYQSLKNKEFISLQLLLDVQERIEHNKAGIRSTMGTVIKNTRTDEIIYTPPQTKDEILHYLNNLLNYINIDDNVDPLLKLPIIHYQFESIHPFYDGNGRTGRILNILYLICMNLLDTPILYLSKYIINNKNEYYRLFQETRETNNFEPWILFFLKGIEQTANGTINIINTISEEMKKTKNDLRNNTKIYSKELLECLFFDFYTKTEYIKNNLGISERTAQRYLNTLVEKGFLTSEKIGRENIYKNVRLFEIIKNFENII